MTTPAAHQSSTISPSMEKLIITAALTGAEVSRAQQPALPITPQEIGLAAHECALAGASVVHVHARNPDGSPTQDKEIYRQIIDEVKSRCDVIVQASTGGAVSMTPQERLAPVTLAPEMATLSMGSVNFGGDVFMNYPADMETFVRAMREHGVKPDAGRSPCPVGHLATRRIGRSPWRLIYLDRMCALEQTKKLFLATPHACHERAIPFYYRQPHHL